MGEITTRMRASMLRIVPVRSFRVDLRSGRHQRIAYPNPEGEEYAFALRLAHESKSRDSLKRVYAWARTHGVVDVLMISRDRLKKLFPRHRLPDRWGN